MKTYRKLHRWHRSFGVIASLFVILLVSTGLLLNHTDQLELDQSFVSSSLLLDWYNIAPPADPVSYATENHRLSQLGGRLYIGERELINNAEPLLGAVEMQEELIVALQGQLLILDQQGELLEKLGGAEGVPTGMKRIGLAPLADNTLESRLVVEGSHGNYLADLDSLHWEEEFPPALLKGMQWSVSSAISETLQEKLYKAYRGKGLSLERVVLDLHSGRLLGPVGVLLIDVAAVLFLILAITGVWMWAKR